MKVIKIGSAPTNDIVLHSTKVSANHATLYLLDCGDIFIKDNGSKNGTFIYAGMPPKLQQISGYAVKINRGDAIKLADAELPWSQVHNSTDTASYKGIYSIGSHQGNSIKVNGATVSQFHATVKVTNDGKVFIEDHSLNGTTVNSQKIPSNSPFRIKRDSAVMCGGVPVNLSHLFPSSNWNSALVWAACLLALVGIGFGAAYYNNLIPDGFGCSKPSIQALVNATARVYGQYYIDVTFEDDPLVGKVKGWPEKWRLGVQSGSDKAIPTLGTLTDKKIEPFSFTGTAFFISEDGELGTNRHIVCPWEYLDNSEKDVIRQEIQMALSTRDNLAVLLLIDALTKKDSPLAQGEKIEDKTAYAQALLSRMRNSKFNISGSFEFVGVALSGTNVSSLLDMHPCQVIAESGDQFKDVALLRLNSKETPRQIVEGGFFDINCARTDETTLKPQGEELLTMGFPAEQGVGLGIVGKGTELMPTIHKTTVSKYPDDDMFQLQTNVLGGQSGSPIIDSKHRLVGVVWGGHRGTEVSYGCNIKHLKELYDKHKVRHN